MPHALVAGVPPAWARQVRAALNAVKTGGWEFSLFPGLKDKEPGIAIQQLDALFQEAASRNGAHIFGVSDNRDRQAIANAAREHFRFRWLPTHVLRSATSNLEPLVGEVTRAVLEEDEWREALHPITKSSPLALPQQGFATERAMADVWALCEAFNKEQGFFGQVAAMIERFKAQHLKKWDRHSQRFFSDERSHIWKDDGPYHGSAPFPRDWKYSSQLPDSFHFDVQHAHGRPFEFRDRSGRTKSIAATKHCNVDAHGYLR